MCPAPQESVSEQQQQAQAGIQVNGGLHGNNPNHSPKWWSKDTIAVVTGSNKGLGHAIAKELAKQGVTVVLTARDEKRGLEAQKALFEEGMRNVVFHQLDISHPESVSKFSSWLKEQFGGLDILVNNAAILHVDTIRDYQAAKDCLDINYFGTKRITEAMLPLFKASPQNARIVNVSSEYGRLQWLTDEALKKHCAALNTEAEIDSLAHKFLKDVKDLEDGKMEKRGWSIEYPYYQVSKLCLNAYTRYLAAQLADRPEGQKIYVNCLCPGVVRTDMTLQEEKLLPGGIAPDTMEEGVDTPLWLALLPAGGPSGLFFYKRKLMEF
nr:short-chain dehydrogenase/reductase 2 [Phlegmariurus tetrastichus]